MLFGALFKSDRKDVLPKGKEACSARYYHPVGPKIWIKNFCKKPATQSLSTTDHLSLHVRPTSSLQFHPPSVLGRISAASLLTSDRTRPTSPSFTLSAFASSDPASFSLSFFNPFCRGPPSAFTFPFGFPALFLLSLPLLSLFPCLSLSAYPHFMQRWGYLRDWASMEKISFGTMNWARGRGEGEKWGSRVKSGGTGHRKGGGVEGK